jgi:hypothetical protein
MYTHISKKVFTHIKINIRVFQENVHTFQKKLYLNKYAYILKIFFCFVKKYMI